MRADHRDRLQPRGTQRQYCLLVLQQNDASLFDLARGLEPGKGIDDAALPWMINDTGCKHRTQDAMHMFIEFSLRNFACVERILEALLVKKSARLFVIK